MLCGPSALDLMEAVAIQSAEPASTSTASQVPCKGPAAADSFPETLGRFLQSDQPPVHQGKVFHDPKRAAFERHATPNKKDSSGSAGVLVAGIFGGYCLPSPVVAPSQQPSAEAWDVLAGTKTLSDLPSQGGSRTLGGTANTFKQTSGMAPTALSLQVIQPSGLSTAAGSDQAPPASEAAEAPLTRAEEGDSYRESTGVGVPQSGERPQPAVSLSAQNRVAGAQSSPQAEPTAGNPTASNSWSPALPGAQASPAQDPAAQSLVDPEKSAGAPLPPPSSEPPSLGEIAEVSNLLGKFEGLEVGLKASGNASGVEGATGESGLPSLPAMSEPANPGSPKPPAGLPQTQLLANSENGGTANVPRARQSLPREAVENASGPSVPSESARSSILSPTENKSNSIPQPGTGSTAGGTAETTAPSVSAAPSSVTATAHANLSNDSAENNERRSPAGASGPAENSNAFKPHSSMSSSAVATDSGVNLAFAHASGNPVNHPSASVGPTEPPQAHVPDALAAWQSYESATGKLVSSARLNTAANSSEMHVELRSESLGPVAVHAVLREGSVGAEIHVQGRDVHNLLTASLPSLERALGERNLSVANLAVYQNHVGGDMNGGDHQNPHSGSPPSAQGQTRHWDATPPPHRLGSSADGIEEIVNLTGGLSVRA